MPKSNQTNKEFVEAAGIAELDAFIAVAIRRTVAQMTETPARELVAERGFEEQIQGRGFHTDWDEGLFLMYLEESFDIDIDPIKISLEAEKTGYSNWFYCPGTSFGEWVRFLIETLLLQYREKIVPPVDWPGLESSDLDSDAEVLKNPTSHVWLQWGCLGLLIIVAIVLIVSKIIENG